jgi:hypothetical protein
MGQMAKWRFKLGEMTRPQCIACLDDALTAAKPGLTPDEFILARNFSRAQYAVVRTEDSARLAEYPPPYEFIN